ncbi:aminotransferase class V-fold PLP-dependent enzyme [Holdemania filiformis]|uniref:aminotransferase class V-fold PLP-dependent enzyme n=1 Tax=Holdemania filiformis TaxID=61171 RepID=UPI00349E5CE0
MHECSGRFTICIPNDIRNRSNGIRRDEHLEWQDKVIVIYGQSFGLRFFKLVKLHRIQHSVIHYDFGKQLRAEQLKGLEDHTALLINTYDTSSGTLYDMDLISSFSKKNNILLIVDAISAFQSDDINMTKLEVAAVIRGS